ncbi:hypothetical protein PC9H_008374 [Pleurotus ostreatus]|uniref:Uncharacterized protein n=1 Tax=Pleurotus ostreatus TaxID=5322 RepID=A0A8H6ZT36_PLEOS|nr:uncharacterized protein PC9H_008374 [Pleurotus ostreatus]KAF7426011.1 hypothetical protein PC9H_008374 [Pleurotus ostreatus]
MSLSHDSHRRRIPLAARYNEDSDASMTAGQADRNKNIICALPKDILTRENPRTRDISPQIHSTPRREAKVGRSVNTGPVEQGDTRLYGTIVVSGNEHDMRFVKSGGAPLKIP